MLDAQVQHVAQDIPWWSVPLFTALLAGVGAYVGGQLGVTWELKKVTKQRAFDYRLEWYMRLLRSLSSFSDANREFRWHIKNKKRGDEFYKARERVVHSITQAGADMRESLLFAPLSTQAVLATMMEGFSATMDMEGEEIVSKLENLDDSVGRAYVAVSKDVREHLGLEPVPRPFVMWK